MRQAIVILVGIVGLGLIWSPQLLDKVFLVKPSTPDAVAGDIASTVPKEARLKVGGFVRDVGAAAKIAKNVQTTDQLRDGSRIATAIAQDSGELPTGLGPFEVELDKILKNAIGLESLMLTDDLRNKYAAACDSVAASLGVEKKVAK